MKRLFACLLLTLLSPFAWADMEVISLHHRTVDEVLPLVRPLLDPDGTATGMNNQLILRTSPRNLAEIRKVLESIDRAPRRLRITVLQDVDRATVSQLLEASGSVTVGGNARVTVSPRAGSGGASVRAGRDEDHAELRVQSTHALEAGRKSQQVQVLEGSRAFIQTGTSASVPQREIVQTPYGTRVTESRAYRDVGSGFYVLPRLSGDRVTLEISAQDDSLQTGEQDYPAARIQRVLTTVSGRLGAWMVLGDIAQEQAGSSAGIASRGSSGGRGQRSVLLKVEEVE